MDIKKYFDNLNINIICAGFANNKDDVFCKDEVCQFNKIYYLKSGNLSVILDGEIKKATSDNMILISEGKKHSITMPKSSKIEAYWIYFDVKSANKNLFDLIETESIVEVDDDELITRLFESILYNVENLPEISKVFNDKCFVLRMISYIIEKGGYRLCQMPLLKIADYMEENMERKLSVGEICEFLKVKNNHCTNLFNETFGTSPLKFLNDIRLLKARTLLENTDMKIGEIGILCGLGDIQAFSKTFKSNIGLTPSKYRHIFGKTFKVE